MNENELIKIMYEENFSKKQIEKLKKISEQYSEPLFVTVHELAGRYFRLLFLHILMCYITLHSYLLLDRKEGHTAFDIVYSISFLSVMSFVIDLFFPFRLTYKARKVVQTIKKERNR